MSREQECSDENQCVPQLTLGRVTFTPKRTRSLPRAWERKPATPFAPRIEGQKIWKRAPLQSMDTNSQQQWHKNNSQKSINMRPVKRLRVGEVEVDEDKENVLYINVKWEEDSHSVKSPRRRVPLRDVAELQPASEIVASTPNILGQTPETTPSKKDDLRSFSIPQASESVDYILQPQLEQQEAGDREEDSPTRQLQAEINHDKTEHMLDEADVFLRISADSSPTSSPASTPASSGFSPINLDSITQPVTMAPRQRKSITPSMRKSPVRSPARVAEPSIIVPALASAPTTEDPDDTSYLQGFLLRSRAQKAAKQRSASSPTKESRTLTSIPTTEEPEDEIMLDIPVDNATTDPSEDDITQPISDNAPEITITIDGQTATRTSPQRRSARTRLPRLQKQGPGKIAVLSNNIALRRLTGSEFIAAQRESQSMAAATRTNTRKNKGPAIAVKDRLEQLKMMIATAGGAEDDETPKEGKRVVWAETLARYQEYVGPELSVGEDDELVESGEADDAEADESDNGKEMVTGDAKKKSGNGSKRVRKLRKESVGSVNGTPAPKRSIEILLEDARKNGGMVSTAGATPSKRTRSKAKS
jgi:hypothetical protein